MKQAIGYVRVSTDKQAHEGFSLEAQAERIKAQAICDGLDVAELIVDAGESAKSLQRPGMARLLALVDAGQVSHVVIAKLDRITRSVGDLAELLKRFDRRGVSLVSVSDKLDTSTASGRLVLNIMVSVSQWEREAIGERTSAVLQHKKAQGQRVGTVSFGFRLSADGVHVEENPGEQKIIAIIREQRERGVSLGAIAARLNDGGYVTRRGTSWKKQNVFNLVRAVV